MTSQNWAILFKWVVGWIMVILALYIPTRKSWYVCGWASILLVVGLHLISEIMG